MQSGPMHARGMWVVRECARGMDRDGSVCVCVRARACARARVWTAVAATVARVRGP